MMLREKGSRSDERTAPKALESESMTPPCSASEGLPVQMQSSFSRTQVDDFPPVVRRVMPRLETQGQENHWKILFFWTLLAFLLRLFITLRFEQVISPDGVQYVALGHNLIAGQFQQGLSIYWPPLYPLLVGLSSIFFNDSEFAGRFVSVVAGSLLIFPSYRLIRNWYGARVALIGIAIIALHPLLIYYSTVLLTESTYTLLFTCGVLTGWTALSGGRPRFFLLAGATFGACYLLKPEAAGFLLLLLIPTLARKFFDRACSLKSSVRNALLLCAGFLLPAAPYLFYLRQQTGTWTLSGKTAGHLWQGSRYAGEYLTPAVLPLMPDSTLALVQLTKALRSEYEIFNLIFPFSFVILAGLGLFRKKWTRGRVWREIYLFSFVAAALLGYAVTLPNIRFIIPLVPLLLCWVSKGVDEFTEWLTEIVTEAKGARKILPLLRKLVVPLVITGLLISLAPLSVYLLRGDKWGDYYGQKRAAMWIKEHTHSTIPVIMSTVPIAAFYAGGRHVALRDEEYATLLARARREQVAYLLVNERNFKFMNLSFLLDEARIHPGLHLVQQITEAPGHKILIYALDETAEAAPDKLEGT